MIDPNNVPSIGEDETLARYVLHSRHVRNDRTVKPDAFVPHPHRDLSVTRHLFATDEELWSVGEQVAAKIGKTLYGRADIGAASCAAQKLTVKATPVEENPNHADVAGWPADKPAQKVIALELAEAANYVDHASP
jgi:hypothetical protein